MNLENIPTEGLKQREYKEAVAELVKSGDTLMEQNSALPYHNIEHPKALYERAEKIAPIFNLSSEEKGLLFAIISYHDVVMKKSVDIEADSFQYNPADPKTIANMGSRNRGAREGDFPAGANGNEAESARLLVSAMKEKTGSDGQAIFSPEQIETAKEAIDATYPNAEFGVPFKNDPLYDKLVAQNPRLGETIDWLFNQYGTTTGPKFSQPHLEAILKDPARKVPKEVLIMSLIDLGGSGITNMEEFDRDGDSEFRELYVNIEKNFGKLAEGKPEDKEARAIAVQRMQGWLQDQIAFVGWQMVLFEKTVYYLKEKGQLNGAQEAELRGNFSRYEDNIKGSVKRRDEIKKAIEGLDELEAFKYIAGQMGYKKEESR